MLTIRGESMINAGILDGDQVIVRKQQSAQNGDIVIAMTDEDEATCKRFFKEQDHIRLQPENDYLEPIILPDVTIFRLSRWSLPSLTFNRFLKSSNLRRFFLFPLYKPNKHSYNSFTNISSHFYKE